MNKILTFASMSAVMISTVFAQKDTVGVNIGITHPLGIFRTDDATVNCNVNLITSNVHSLNGLDIAGVASIVQTTANGLQVGYLASMAQQVIGIQASGVYNSVREDVLGYQATGVYNRVEGNLSGAQFSGIVNSVKGDMSGYQASGVFNSVKGNFSGIQAGGVVNHVGGISNGGQIGLVNISQDITGFQVGLVNIAGKISGVPLGLINIADNGKISIIAYGSNFSGVNVGAKFNVNNFVSTITAGGYDYAGALEQTVSFGASWGYQIPINPIYIEMDIATINMFETTGMSTTNTNDDTVDSRNLSALRLTAGWEITSYLGIFAGAGAGVEVESGRWEDPSFKPLYYAGLTIF